MQAELDERTDMPAKLREYLQRAMDERRASSIEIRSAKPGGSSVRDMFASREPQSEQAFWLRARSKSRDDPAFHKCVSVGALRRSSEPCSLAYASDMQFIGTGAKALGLSSRSKPKLAMMVRRASSLSLTWLGLARSQHVVLQRRRFVAMASLPRALTGSLLHLRRVLCTPRYLGGSVS